MESPEYTELTRLAEGAILKQVLYEMYYAVLDYFHIFSPTRYSLCHVGLFERNLFIEVTLHGLLQ